MADSRRALIMVSTTMCLMGLARESYAAGSLPNAPNIEHRFPLRVVETLDCDLASPSCSPSIPYAQVRADLDRANTFWRHAGVEFWIKSFEYAHMPNLNVRTTEEFSWPEVRDELQQLFPKMPDNAFSDSDCKMGKHWYEAASAYYGDPNEIFVAVVKSGGSVASFPWRGRVVFVSATDIPSTTFGHELGHYLGLQHTQDGLPTHPNPNDSYTNCDQWDMVFKPTTPPQFFSSSSAPGCNDPGLQQIASALDLLAPTASSMVTVKVQGSVFSPGAQEIKGLVASNGLTHQPPVWGYAINLMGGFDTEIGAGGAGATISSQTPRFISASQARIVEDFLTWDVDFIAENVNLIRPSGGGLPLDGSPQGLRSQRTKLAKSKSDFLWWSNGALASEVSFASATYDIVDADLTPVAGDFDGDGYDDLVWYQPSTGQAAIWWSSGDRTFAAPTVLNFGTDRVLFSGDFDGNGSDDLFFYAPGTGEDRIYYGSPFGFFSTEETVDAAGYEPFAADMDGDGDDDIVWYVPSSGDADIWWGDGGTQPPDFAGTTFTVQAGVSVGNGLRYTPVVGDFDGVHGTDVLWYAAGAGADALWRSQGTQTPSKTTLSIDGFYHPVAGDFDADGQDDILWDHAIETRAPVWRGVFNSASFAQGAEASLPGFSRGIAGDFDGDGATDVFWYRQSPQRWTEMFHYNGGWRVDQHPRLMADVNNDGRGDIIGFGNSGTEVSVSSGFGFSASQQWLQAFHTGGGWEVSKHPRLMADVNNDGRDDVIGFGSSGVDVSRSTGTGFTSPVQWVENYHYDAGWRVDKHPRLMADVDADGRADVIGFGNSGTYVSRSNGSGFTAAALWVAGFHYNGLWRVEKHPRMTADVDGDGRADIVGFGNSGTYVSRSTGAAFLAPQLWIQDFHYNDGWLVEKHPRVTADVDGDGRDDVVGFGEGGVEVSLSTGSSFTAPAVWTNDFGYDRGWRVEQHPRILADVNGDGMADIVGFANPGVYVAFSTGAGFSGSVPWIDNFSYEQGSWRVESHPRFVTDVTGDGRADIVGCGNSGTYVTPSDFSFTP